jgi:hypothetical protein
MFDNTTLEWYWLKNHWSVMGVGVIVSGSLSQKAEPALKVQYSKLLV